VPPVTQPPVTVPPGYGGNNLNSMDNRIPPSTPTPVTPAQPPGTPSLPPGTTPLPPERSTVTLAPAQPSLPPVVTPSTTPAIGAMNNLDRETPGAAVLPVTAQTPGDKATVPPAAPVVIPGTQTLPPVVTPGMPAAPAVPTPNP